MLLPREDCQVRLPVHPPEYSGAILQAGLGGCPWRVAVASILLCRARRSQAEPVLRRLLSAWPDASMLCRAEWEEVAEVVRPCGLHRNRARTLIRMSGLYLSDAWNDLEELPGVGVYVADAVAVVCFGSNDVRSNDHALLSYVAARQAAVRDEQAQSERPIGVHVHGHEA